MNYLVNLKHMTITKEEVDNMNKFRQFMQGRYGFDMFSQVLVVASLIISLVASLFRISTLSIISYIPLGYAIYRMLSKDINKRVKENYKFNSMLNSLKKKARKTNNVINITKKSKTHKYYKCPKCKQAIRVPKGKGKILITCPKCKNEFVKRT